MKIAFLADTHFRGRDLDAALAQFDQALQIANDRGCETVVVLGDTFDRTNIHDKHETTGRIIAELSDLLLDYAHLFFYLIDGNHDRPNNNVRSANWALSGLPNVYVIETPQVIDIGACSAVMVPWMYGDTPDAAIERLGVKLWPPTVPAILCGHMQVVGAFFAKGVPATGGTFAITPDELSAFPFDRVFLGDFHMRQDVTGGRGGYVGALREMNFGEEGNGGHMEIWDAATGDHEHVILDAAPTHLTIEWEKDAAFPGIPAGNQIVRVRPVGWVPEDADVPAGNFKLDPIIDRPTAAARIEHMAEAVETSPSEALRMWLSVNETDADESDLYEIVAELQSELPEMMPPSPVRFISSEMENFGPHEHLVVDWTRYGNLAGIIGSNGAGKTFAMEADFAALFGELPSYGGGLYESVRQGQDTCILETTFGVGADMYCVRREINAKSRTQKAWLSKSNDGHHFEPPFAGPKVGDVAAHIERLIGPPRVALATWFAAQGGVGDICMMKRADVRTVFADMKNLAFYDALSQRAGAIAKDAAKSADRFQVLIDSLATAPDDLAAAETKYAECQAVSDAAHRRLESAIAERDAADAEWKAVNEQVERARAAEQARMKRSVLDEKIAAAETRIRMADEYTAEIARLEQVEDPTAIIDRHNAAVRARDLAAQTTAHIATMREQLIAVADADRELAASSESVSAELARVRVLHSDLSAQLQATRSSIATTQGRIRALEDIAAPTGHVGDDACAPCSLFRLVAESRIERDRLAVELDTLRKRELDLQARVTKGDTVIAEMTDRAAQAKDVARRIADAESRNARVQADIDRQQEIVTSADALAGDIQGDIAALIEQQTRARDAASRIVALRSMMPDASPDELARLTAERDAIDVPDADVPENLHEVRAKFESAVARCEFERTAADRADTLLALARSELTAAERKMENYRSHTIARQDAAGRARTHAIVRDAFGKTGAPALILDHATRTLEVAASRMLSEATEGAMSLVIATTTETQDDRTIEDFSIRIRDRHGERDVSRISGGESRLVRIVLRRALMSWLSTNGGDIRVDEAFDALDDDRAGALIAALSQVSGDGQIVLVTHNTEHAARLPRIIDVAELRRVAA